MRRSALVFILALAAGCAATIARPTAYGVKLQACTAESSTLEQSLACEERVRAEFGRAPLDGGAE